MGSDRNLRKTGCGLNTKWIGGRGGLCQCVRQCVRVSVHVCMGLVNWLAGRLETVVMCLLRCSILGNLLKLPCLCLTSHHQASFFGCDFQQWLLGCWRSSTSRFPESHQWLCFCFLWVWDSCCVWNVTCCSRMMCPQFQASLAQGVHAHRSGT